jgi:hypothetical protein
MSVDIIITTINSYHDTCIDKYLDMSCNIIVVGDLKTPNNSYLNKDISYITSDNKIFSNFSKMLPYNHYCRKNIGYLQSINNNSTIIFDTDDDNGPLCDITNINGFLQNSKTVYGQKFPNVLSLFTDIDIWGRGYPIELLNKKEEIKLKKSNDTDIKNIGIIQSLSDGDPDVDAIYRLTNKNYNSNITFDVNKCFILEKNVYTQGNTQSTLWINKELFFLLYIPSTVSFRFCDILKMYIAQRCMWEYNKLFCYISPIVYQDRNEHDYMNDFVSEYPMYVSILNIVNNIFDTIVLHKNKNDLMIIYKELYKNNIVKEKELDIIEEWLRNI